MTIEKMFEILEMIDAEYANAVSQDWIEKPLAEALYHVWMYVDAHEKKRGRKESEDGKEAKDEEKGNGKADPGAGGGNGRGAF